MLKYRIVYSGGVAGRNTKFVECDFVSQPQDGNPMINFHKREEDNTSTVVLSVNPSCVYQVELIEGEEVAQSDGKIVDVRDGVDPLSGEAFGHDTE